MQTRGTFPELNAGLKKPAKKLVGKENIAEGLDDSPRKRTNGSGKFRKTDTGSVGFAGVNGRGPRPGPSNPLTYSGRRDAAHAKARRGK